MPTLNWIGKEKVINHHQEVPYRILEHKYGFNNGKQNKSETNSGNKIVFGDNLEALKALLPEYEGKIKCIYIDPPYNTGNENWVYNDNVNHPKIKKWLGEVVGREGEDLSRHDKWLCMLYPRLKLLHKLLADNGAIFISIDDGEQGNLRLICDEVFGNNNFITNIIWEKNYSPRNDANFFSASHDFIVCYCKNKLNWIRNLLPRTEKQNNFYKYDDNDGRGLWRPDNVLVKSFSKSGVFGIKNPNTGVEFFPPEGSCYRFNYEKSQELLKQNKLYFGKDGRGKPQLKRYLSEVIQGVVPQTLWKHEEVGHNQDGKKELNKIISGNVFDSPKPYQLIVQILKVSTNKNDIILDSFAGSGTTGHAVLNLNKDDGGNKKFILVEMEDYADSITAERVKRVIKGYSDIEGTGGSFDYYELGIPLFKDGKNLNADVPLENIRQYIFYTETGHPLDKIKSNDNEYFLNIHHKTAYYFYYKKSEATTLDYNFLSSVKSKTEQYVIYADNCLLDTKFLLKKNIIFKKIPRDITKL